jgi:hypothetical protein
MWDAGDGACFSHFTTERPGRKHLRHRQPFIIRFSPYRLSRPISSCNSEGTDARPSCVSSHQLPIRELYLTECDDIAEFRRSFIGALVEK